MRIVYDKYKQPVAPKIYLGTPNNKPICVSNGIDEDSFNYTPNVNNTCEISFDVHRFIDIDGEFVETNGYDFIDTLMRVYMEGVGWFCLEAPSISNDGIKEIKHVRGQSAEIEMSNHHFNGLKINKGTTDSYEMLVDGNVEIIDDVEFAKKQIKFCDKDNEDLSLLHILLKESGMYGWTIGYIDDIPKLYKNYVDGELVETAVALSDEIGSFDFETNDLYSSLTQTMSQYFNCVFEFDSLKFEISAYRPEHLGKNTNVNLGFRNVEVSNNVESDENNLYTRYNVSGGENLDIRYVNFGSDIIENLSYYMTEKHMPSSLIPKYKLWLSDVENKRIDYIENTRLYNEQQKIISELYDRVPLDDCSTDWSTFSDDKLLEAKANYEAQLAGYESFYVDEDGNFDEAALQASVDANDYYQIKDVILPSIQIEIDNREILNPDSDHIQDYIDTYLTDWKLYGLDELQVKLDSYENTRKLCVNAGYDKPYSDESEHTEDIHTAMYEKYLDAVNQLDTNFVGGCKEAYDIRKSEIDTATALQKTYDDTRKEVAKVYDKEQWVNGEISFTESDLRALSRLYKDTTYTNENMFLTSSDDSVTAIDEQLKLLHDAIEDLETYSQPQYTYTVSLNNFLAMPEFEEYTSNLEMADFLYLGVRDDYVVKLRLMSASRNPLKNDNSLSMTFSNMLTSKSKRNDFINLLGSSNGSKGGSRSGGSSDYVQNEGVGLTPALIQKLVSSGAFSNKVSQIISNEYVGVIGGGGNMSLPTLNSKLIKVVDLFAENGFFEYLQAKLITTDKIVSDSGIFNQIFIKEGTVVKELVAVEIDGDLIKTNSLQGTSIKGGSITADKLMILGENGMYYKLNVDSLGGLTVQEMLENDPEMKTELENGLHGDALIKKTVTAEKIYVDDLNAFGATIGGFKITDNSIYSGEKSEIGSSKEGIYQDTEGQFEVGNLNNYIRFYKYENGEFHLEINANKITLSSGQTIEEFVDGEITTKIDDPETGVRSEFNKKADELSASINTNAGEISTVKLTTSGLDTRVTDNEGNISTLKDSSDKFDKRIKDCEGNFTSLQATASGLDILIGNASDTANKAKEDVNNLNNEIKEWFKFSEDGLEIGKINSVFKTLISNDMYQILINGLLALALDPDGFSLIPELNIIKTLKLLGYKIDEDEYGNVNCGYEGGE